jgi:cell division protein FtsB
VIRRIVFAVLGLAALIFVVQGGEFGTWDLVRQRSRRAELTAAIDSLERDIDSLRKLKAAVETDPAVQERIARERFGYVRGDKEILYRFTDPRRDSAGVGSEP